MNLERTKPEQLAAGVMDYMPSQSAVAHEYAERLNAALARLGLTDRMTLPPAPNTAIDELPAVVDVPLRKTLSVLMGKAQQGDASALATLEWTAQVAESIFAGLHARDFAGDRPLALPSHESLATLSQGVDALLPRKISNGAWSLLADGTPSDGIDDGMSLVRLFCTDAFDSVTELKDDNEGWVCNKENYISKLVATFPNAEKLTIQSGQIIAVEKGGIISTLKEFNAPKVKSIVGAMQISIPNGIINAPLLETLTLSGYNNGWVGPMAKEIYMPKVTHITGYNRYFQGNTIIMQKWVLGTLKQLGWSQWGWTGSERADDLIHFEIGKGTAISLNFNFWTASNILSDSERLPIFLSNFKTYIAERVEDRTGKAALTLTLSAAVYEALEAQEGQTIIATLTNKNWTVASA